MTFPRCNIYTHTKQSHCYRAMQDHDSDSESTASTDSTCSSSSGASTTSLDPLGNTEETDVRTDSPLLLLPYEIRNQILREVLPHQVTYRCPQWQCLRQGAIWNLGNIAPFMLCRQLYAECFAIMYEHARFELLVDAQKSVFKFYARKGNDGHRQVIATKYFTSRSAYEPSALVGQQLGTEIWSDVIVCNMQDLTVYLRLDHDRYWHGAYHNLEISQTPVLTSISRIRFIQDQINRKT